MTKEDNAKKSGQQPKAELKFSQEQYDMLIRCSDKKDVTEWNEWRKKNLGEMIFLEGADFSGANLSRVDLTDYRGIALDPKVYLKGASFIRANLEHGQFIKSDLRDVDFTEADMIGAMLSDARLEYATLQGVKLNGRYGMYSFYFRGSCFDGAQLQGADFRRSIVDSSTSFWDCALDRDTDFREAALGSVQLENGKKELLRYNIRRKNWEDWYKYHPKIKWLVKAFWSMSDYGSSTGRIVLTFFILAFVFAGVYRLFPNCVLANGIPGNIKGFVHALYFSVVTMTTLGFGDIAANPDNWQGQVLLMFQVIFGYVLLGALVTRFAVLFTAGGPAGKFSPIKTKEISEDD